MVNEPPAPGGSKVERFWTNLWRSSKFDNFGSSKTIKKMWPEGAHFQLVCNIILYVCLSVPLFLGNCWSDFTWDFVRRSESKKMGFVACCMHNCTEISRIIRNRELTNLNFSIYMNSVYFLYIDITYIILETHNIWLQSIDPTLWYLLTRLLGTNSGREIKSWLLGAMSIMIFLVEEETFI
jgi:hypothetical protein